MMYDVPPQLSSFHQNTDAPLLMHLAHLFEELLRFWEAATWDAPPCFWREKMDGFTQEKY